MLHTRNVPINLVGSLTPRRALANFCVREWRVRDQRFEASSRCEISAPKLRSHSSIRLVMMGSVLL